MTVTRLRVLVALTVAASAVALSVQRGEAHKAITSKYTYNDDVFPILRERCASCHVAGGVAPMSLMTYDEAFPWAESIRAELVASHMPPWNAEDGFGEFKHAHVLSPKELDVILTWATGGNPRGALDQQLPAVTLKNDWILGKPDLALPLPTEYAFAADKMDDTAEFTIATATTEARWVRAVDLLPGTPSIVRSALIYIKGANAADSKEPAPETVLARWVPGHDPEAIEGAALRLPAGAQIVARIHYKKTWQFEGKALSDRSTVGIYFSKGTSARELLTLPIVSGALPAPGSNDHTVTFSRTLDDDVQAVAFSPDQVPPNITLQVEAVLPDGTRTPIIRLLTRQDWDRRYWFERPISLPRGTKVEVRADLEDPDLMSTAFGGATPPKPVTQLSAVRLALNVLPAKSAPSAP
jgi:hypothetical protein